MNAYQNKWIELLKSANLPGWAIEASGEDIVVTMPHVTDLKVIRDNLPEIVGAVSLDIELPAERLKFTFKNGYEEFEYILNPAVQDLNEE